MPVVRIRIINLQSLEREVASNRNPSLGIQELKLNVQSCAPRHTRLPSCT